MPTWYPGQVAVGQKVFAEQVLFGGAAPPVFQKGVFTIPPVILTPGTVPSPGTVTNNTGYDVMVYASATTGISAAKFASQGGSASVGTIGPAQGASYYLAAGQSLALTYTGTLTWTWLAV